MRRRLVLPLAILAILAASLPVGADPAPEGPAIASLTWLPRTGPEEAPTVHLRLGVEAPSGLASGRLTLASVHHEILHTESIGPLPAGSGAVDVSFEPPGDVYRGWNLIGLELRGADGRVRTYGFCDLVTLIETRERPSAPRLSVDCLNGAGWVVYTFRVDEAPEAMIWMRGVATRNHTYAGTGHVLQDAQGTVIRWGTGVSVAYPQTHEGTQVSLAGTTVVDEPAPDPAAQPGPNRIVVGVGGSAPADLVPGATYRWGAYYAVRPGHFDLPYISLEGSGITVLDVQRGATAGIAWGRDFDPSLVVQRSAANAAVIADGAVTRSFSTTTTAMFSFLAGRIGDAASAAAFRIEGPSAPPVGGVVVAGQPGEYRFRAAAGIGTSWSQFVVGYADMPLTPQAPA